MCSIISGSSYFNNCSKFELPSPGSGSANEESEHDSNINVNCANKCKRLRTTLSAKVSPTLDCTKPSIPISAMIMLSAPNESGTESILLPLKSTILCQLQLKRIEIAKGYFPIKSVVHLDGKLLPDIGQENPG